MIAEKVTGMDEVKDGPDGCFSFTVLYRDPSKKAGIEFKCPCGCGLVGYLPINGEGRPGPSWDWDGDEESPTLSPSVYNTGFPCKWHGWLRNGKWESV